MSIQSLADSTARAIGSSIVIHNATTVVKELVDNALDANATIISVEISSNTLDVVQVKDNGSGIGVEDRQLVCKRGCTSKIRTVNDLELLGGSSLGFRGEALASVAEISEGLTVTTRIDGESVGSVLTYGKAGALVSSASASHPVGTTIRVINLLQLVPVRRQSALKTASKTLFSIQRLLKTYAFARGAIRFSLKVLKGKNDKANWQYSPVSDSPSLKEVAANIVSRDITSWCEYRTSVFSPVSDEIGGGEYSVQALLAGFEDDASKFNNVGHFISIDGRPVSSTRGSMKEVVKLYRSHYRNAATRASNSKLSSEPFLCMNIRCPLGSYDVNIEPTKDDVLFMSPAFVTSLIDGLFKDFYGDSSCSGSEIRMKSRQGVTADAEKPFEVLLARKPPPAESIEDAHLLTRNKQLRENNEATATITKHQSLHSEAPKASIDKLSLDDKRLLSTSSPRKVSQETLSFEVHSNMYSMDRDEMFNLPPSSPDSQNVQKETEDAESSAATNPWAIAKLNAPAKPQNNPDQRLSPRNVQLLSPDSGPTETSSRRVLAQAPLHCSPLSSARKFPTPTTSPQSSGILQNPGPPARRRAPALNHDEERDLPLRKNNGTLVQTPKCGFGLDGWATPLAPRAELPSFKRVSEMYEKDGRIGREPDNEMHYRETREGKQPGKEPLQNEVPTEVDPKNHISRPCKSPMIRLSGSVLTDSDMSLAMETSARQGTEAPSRGNGTRIGQRMHLGLGKEHFETTQPRNNDLDQIMDFEHRKKATIAQQRKKHFKFSGRGMDAWQLAQLQQTSSQTSLLSRHPESVAELASISENVEGTAKAAFENRFGDGGNVQGPASKSNPYTNRYTAAIKSLSRNNPGAPVDDTYSCESVEVREDVDELPRLPDVDPRSYLIRQQSQIQAMHGNGLTKAGFKIHRTKTQMLPLESVPIGLTLHNTVAYQPFAPQDILSELDMNNVIDLYAKTGKNQSLRWPFTEAEVDDWQKRLDTMIHNMYRAKVDEELVTPEVRILLKRTLKVHCDNI